MPRKLLALAALATLALPAAALAPGAKAEITGYVTDSHCAMKGASKTHTAKCIETCMKGGARPQILNQADNRLYTLDSLEKVKDFVGVRVTLKGTLSSDGTAFTVTSAEKASSPELP